MTLKGSQVRPVVPLEADVVAARIRSAAIPSTGATGAPSTNCVGETVGETVARQPSGREVTADLLFAAAPTVAAPTGFEPVSPP